ncbi:MAG: hypothetical protein CMO55_08525 [Verrucomicrobiales bacterium]|nr:hypothetical protein [Verrucomicrobiales bacterium]
MFSDRSSLVREKKFLPPPPDGFQRGPHSSATLTDDHTLFLLNQQRELRAKSESKNWLQRIFRRH